VAGSPPLKGDLFSQKKNQEAKTKNKGESKKEKKLSRETKKGQTRGNN
jgi:hypothetical protein